MTEQIFGHINSVLELKVKTRWMLIITGLTTGRWSCE